MLDNVVDQLYVISSPSLNGGVVTADVIVIRFVNAQHAVPVRAPVAMLPANVVTVLLGVPPWGADSDPRGFLHGELIPILRGSIVGS